MKSPNCGTVKCNVVASVPAGLGHACGGSFEPIFPVRRLSTLIRRSVFSIDLRQEPYEVILHVRICAGDGQQWPFLPRPLDRAHRFIRRCQQKYNPTSTPAKIFFQSQRCRGRRGKAESVDVLSLRPPRLCVSKQMNGRNREQCLRSKHGGRKMISESKDLKYFAPHFSTDSFSTIVRTKRH